MKKNDSSGIKNTTEPYSFFPVLLYKTSLFLKRIYIPILVISIHLILISTITISMNEQQQKSDTTIFKMVDVKEYVPPLEPEPHKDKKEMIKEKSMEVPVQPEIAETIIETDKTVIENKGLQNPGEIEYIPQHKISVSPVFPTEQILAQIKYPVLANKQRIEGVVYLELYIDKQGIIRKIVVLKDPGYGLARAAVDALEGIICEPAKANGEPVAVRFRYPIRFQLK